MPKIIALSLILIIHISSNGSDRLPLVGDRTRLESVRRWCGQEVQYPDRCCQRCQNCCSRITNPKLVSYACGCMSGTAITLLIKHFSEKAKCKMD